MPQVIDMPKKSIKQQFRELFTYQGFINFVVDGLFFAGFYWLGYYHILVP